MQILTEFCFSFLRDSATLARGAWLLFRDKTACISKAQEVERRKM